MTRIGTYATSESEDPASGSGPFTDIHPLVSEPLPWRPRSRRSALDVKRTGGELFDLHVVYSTL